MGDCLKGVIHNRLGKCEVCDNNVAKYTCPRCEVKTCSLPCVNVHKWELGCSGLRDKVKFKYLTEFTDLDLQNDYFLLEQTGREAEKIRNTKRSLLTFTSKRQRDRCFKLKNAARKRGINLLFIPIKFSRHRDNSTFLDWKKDELFWSVEWVFPSASGLKVKDERIKETSKLSEAISQYIDNDKCEDKSISNKLAVYQNATSEGCKILLKAEKISGDKFFLANCNETIKENLKQKTIVEYPIFYVILAGDLPKYNIIHLIKRNQKNETKNLLMNAEDDIEEEPSDDL